MKKDYTGKKGMLAFMGIVKTELEKVATSVQNKLDTALGSIDTDLTGKIDSTEKGVASGVAPLDESGLVPAEHLPSYVDDVIDMSNVGDEDGGDKWVLVDPDTGVTEEEIQFTKGKIYLDVDNNVSYRWSGTALVDITSPDMNEITPEEIQTMWDSLANSEEGGETGGNEGDENA